jgi:hypothetical protein
MIRRALIWAGIIPGPEPITLDPKKEARFWKAATRPNRPAPFWKK